MNTEYVTQTAADWLGTRPIGWRAYVFRDGRQVWQSRAFLKRSDAKVAAMSWISQQGVMAV